MTKELNLALLIKKQEEMRKQEMEMIKAGSREARLKMAANATGCSCSSFLIAADTQETDYWRSCNCGSIWVILGLQGGI